jgi:hypothetical protein
VFIARRGSWTAFAADRLWGPAGARGEMVKLRIGIAVLGVAAVWAVPTLAERSRVLLKDGHVIVMDDMARIDCPIAGFHAVMQVWSCRHEQADYWMVETRVGRAAVEGWVEFCDGKLTEMLRRQLGPGFVAGRLLPARTMYKTVLSISGRLA